jgi:transcriptional regulator with XRE-family HTH domain
MTDSVKYRGAEQEADGLGQRTKALRLARNLTLDALSRQCGVSRASLSKIERGEMSPTYETLRKLANGLDVALTTLVVETNPIRDDDIQIVRSGEGKRYGNPLYGYELLSGSPDVLGQTIYISEIAAQDIDAFPEKHSHDTIDFFYVLEGTISAHFEGREVFELAAGDSLTFDGRRPHAFVKSGTATTNPKVIWVSRPQ